MIKNHDRSGWFGASDTETMMGEYSSKTFARFWAMKLGLLSGSFSNVYTAAGTMYESPILDALNLDIQKDRQLKLRKLRLRVNLDGETENTIYEVKTHRADKPFKVPFRYWAQVQVQMCATKKHRAFIVSYGLCTEDYVNFFNPIDLKRMEFIEIQYDPEWIEKQYLPRLKYLAKCLKKGAFPGSKEGKWRYRFKQTTTSA